MIKSQRIIVRQRVCVIQSRIPQSKVAPRIFIFVLDRSLVVSVKDFFLVETTLRLRL